MNWHTGNILCLSRSTGRCRTWQTCPWGTISTSIPPLSPYLTLSWTPAQHLPQPMASPSLWAQPLPAIATMLTPTMGYLPPLPWPPRTPHLSAARPSASRLSISSSGCPSPASLSRSAGPPLCWGPAVCINKQLCRPRATLQKEMTTG